MNVRHLAVAVAFVVAVDVDGTLYNKGILDEDVRNLIIAFSNLGATVVVWSGGGADYARHAMEKAQLIPFVAGYGDKTGIVGEQTPDLTIDDQNFKYGGANFQIPGREEHIPWQAI